MADPDRTDEKSLAQLRGPEVPMSPELVDARPLTGSGRISPRRRYVQRPWLASRRSKLLDAGSETPDDVAAGE